MTLNLTSPKPARGRRWATAAGDDSGGGGGEVGAGPDLGDVVAAGTVVELGAVPTPPAVVGGLEVVEVAAVSAKGEGAESASAGEDDASALPGGTRTGSAGLSAP